MLVDEAGVAEDVRGELVDRVLSDASTAELKAANDDVESCELCRYGCVHEGKRRAANRSMFLLFARLSAKIPFLTRTSRDMGSMPFWLMTTKDLGFSFELTSRSHTRFLSSTIFFSFASTNRRSDSTSFSL